MITDFMIDSFLALKSFQRIKVLLHTLTGVELVFLDANGVPVLPREPAVTNSLEQFDFPQMKFLPNPHELKSVVSFELLEEVALSRKYQIFIDTNRMSKILLPIVFEENVLGFLITGENNNFRFNTEKLTAIANFLKGAIDQLVENDLKFYNNLNGSDETHQKKMVNRVLEYIGHKYYQSGLSLAEVSKNNGISYHYLSHLFHKELKTSFSAYLTNLRMEVAMRLLSDVSLTVSEIAGKCGFDDPAYFSKVFKKYIGKTPGEFRAQLIDSHHKVKRSQSNLRLRAKYLNFKVS